MPGEASLLTGLSSRTRSSVVVCLSFLFGSGADTAVPDPSPFSCTPAPWVLLLPAGRSCVFAGQLPSACWSPLSRAHVGGWPEDTGMCPIAHSLLSMRLFHPCFACTFIIFIIISFPARPMECESRVVAFPQIPLASHCTPSGAQLPGLGPLHHPLTV